MVRVLVVDVQSFIGLMMSSITVVSTHIPSDFCGFMSYFAKRHWLSIAISFTIIALGYFLVGFGTSAMLRLVTDRLYDSRLTFTQGVQYFIGFAVCSTFWAITYGLIQKSEFGYRCAMRQDINNSLFQYTLQHTQQYFSNNFAGTLSSKVNDVSKGIVEIIGKSFEVVCSYGSFILFTIYFIQTNVWIGVICFVWLIFYTASSLWLSKVVGSKMERVATQENVVTGHMVDCFTNIANVKNFVRESYEKGRMHQDTLQVLRAEHGFQWWKGIIYLQTFVSMVLLVTGTAIIPLRMALAGTTSVGNLFFIVNAIGGMTYWIKFAMDCLMEMFADYGRIQQGLTTLMVPHGINNTSATAQLPTRLVLPKGSIEIHNLSFSYGATGPKVFEHLNLSIPSGMKVGLVGYSGAGKSSLINLLLRVYDATEGEILLDGYNIQTELTQAALRRNISYIPQDPILFHRSVRENIAYGKLDATQEEIAQAAKRAYCDEFIQGLEQQYDTLVGERGIKLSGGQRQRIAIARAILKNAPILILDEATSALDSMTEHDIQLALTELMQHKTVIAIAHRLSTLDNMDRIIVMDQGKIIEDGSKAELLANPQGLFSRLWQMQKDGFVKDMEEA